MKYFNENLTFTKEGDELTDEIRSVLKPLYLRMDEKGICIRDLLAFVVREATLLESEIILNNQQVAYRSKKKLTQIKR